jgi:DNA-directed RNA polymerase specialized sigma24 family protein
MWEDSMATQPPDEESDEDLVRRIAEDRDEVALTLLARRATPRAMGFLKRKYSGRMREPEMKQAVTDAFFNVWRFADRFSPNQGDFGSWFIRIVQTAAQNILRGEKKHVAKELEFDPVYNPADPDVEEDDLLTDCPNGHPGGVTRVQMMEDIIENELKGFEQVVARRDVAVGGTADSHTLAAEYGKTLNTVYVTRKKVRDKIRDGILAREARKVTTKGSK